MGAFFCVQIKKYFEKLKKSLYKIICQSVNFLGEYFFYNHLK